MIRILKEAFPQWSAVQKQPEPRQPAVQQMLFSNPTNNPLTGVMGQGPRFGFTPVNPGMFLRIFDLAVPWESTVPINKLAYGSVITSRVVASRTENERNEVFRRDPLGWFFWFMGNPLMQISLIFTMAGNVMRPLLYRPIPEPNGGFARIFWKLDPTSRVALTSDVQLQQRQKQIAAAMQRSGVAKDVMDATANLFKRTLNMRYLISAIGLLFSFVALGWGITAINIALTRAAMEQKRQQQFNSVVGSGNGARFRSSG